MNYSGPVVFFDGVCNLCNGAVQFIIRKDKKGLFRFASLQSAAGRDAIAQTGTAGTEGAEGSIILRYKGKYYVRSSAALKIAALMGGLMWLLLPGYLLPVFVRDGVYRYIARNRYKWFGRREECMVPTPELKARFLVD